MKNNVYGADYDVNVHLLYDYVLKKQFTVRITHYDLEKEGEGEKIRFLQDMRQQ